MKILNNKDLIWALLLENVNYRNNDNLLAAAVWNEQCANLDQLSAIQFLDLLIVEINIFQDLLIENKVAHFETIRRTRALLQKEIPALRGTLYNKRKGLQEDVKKEIVTDLIQNFNALYRQSKKA